MSWNMPAGATSDQYDEWAGSFPPLTAFTPPTHCIEHGCNEPIDQRIRHSMCTAHALSVTLYRYQLEPENPTLREWWKKKYLADLMKLGWCAK